MSPFLATIAAGSFIALAASLIASQAAAQNRNIQCGATYSVQSGDTLSRIARATYKSERDFQIIYLANRDVIGSNPGLIEIGMELEIPCIGGTLEASTADGSAITIAKTTEQLPAPVSDRIRIVAGTDWAPFVHEDYDQGGMITEVTNVALAAADGSPDYKIDFINDWGAHLQPLISDHAYDFSIAWFRPNCQHIEKLGEESQFRCNNLAFSDALFEQIFGYYNRESEAPLLTYASLLGKTVCRPAGYALFMMEEHDLIEPRIKLERPVSVAECFEGLVNGEFDVVAIASDVGQGAINELRAQGAVRYNENLSQVMTMHAVISNTHPRLEEYLDTFNSGVKKIKENGEWFSIVRRHLTAHRSQAQS